MSVDPMERVRTERLHGILREFGRGCLNAGKRADRATGKHSNPAECDDCLKGAADAITKLFEDMT